MNALRLTVCILSLSVGVARANVPVDDAAQLTQKSQTRTDTDNMVPVQQDQNKNQKGINCATHTGQQGNARDTTTAPNESTATQAVQQYNPDATAPTPAATGPALAMQTTEFSAGKVVAGNAATQATITSTGPVYQQASASAGQSATIMAGYDANSSGGVQNGMSWNQVMATANLWVEAYNAINLARISGFSQGAQAMQFVPWAAAHIAPQNSACGAGYRGNGTATDPCIATSSALCQSLSDGGCWERRYVDGLGNVVVYLESTQTQSSQSR